MAGSQSNQYKNEKRIERKGLIRQSIFISEYVQRKYPDLYHEAGLMYNEMNTKYPRKPDLRKCTEFREWKNSIAVSNGQQTTSIPREKYYKYNRTEYSNIVIKPTNEPPIESPTTQQENRCLNPSITPRIMCLNIPLMSTPCDSTSYKITIEEPNQTTDPSTPQEPATQEPNQTTDPSTPQEPNQTTDPSTPQEPATQEPNQTTDPSTPQEPNQTTDPSTPQESPEQCMDPSIMEQLPPEIVEKIIRELHLDPDLKELMDDVQAQIEEEVQSQIEEEVQSQVEEEIIGLEVDVPELDYLMDQDLMFW